ncbi:hypothetical protein APTSU1_000588300 [Apodemus speciosus]|uniref:Uncharacterized protein n=1 Tax=Apodemus speciosus TaxID=105296 RepID=A0ABQ0EUE2_APOSI
MCEQLATSMEITKISFLFLVCLLPSLWSASDQLKGPTCRSGTSDKGGREGQVLARLVTNKPDSVK